MPDDRIENEPPVEGVNRLYDGQSPGPQVEQRVISALRREGLLQPTLLRRVRPLGVAATILLAFATGFGTARWSAERPPATASQAQWVMLLYAGPDAQAPERVAEYNAWAEQVRDSGVVISGEKLARGGYALAWDSPQGHWSDNTDISGYFVVRAPDYERALRIARTCPHIRYGGKVELRQIVPT